jgi:hypothetical protein
LESGIEEPGALFYVDEVDTQALPRLPESHIILDIHVHKGRDVEDLGEAISFPPVHGVFI